MSVFTGKKPNLLIVMADQMAAPFLRIHGGQVARTPHLDQLAAEAVVFDKAYCNSPLCGPSRYSFMSGRLPSVIGAYDNAVEYPASLPSFGHYLRAAGYRTILAGKMHFVGPDQLHGFEERLTTDIYPADFGWIPDWEDFSARPDWYHNMGSVQQAGLCQRSNQLEFDEEVMFHARRKLFDLARQDDDRPFCLFVSLTHPHDPFAITQDYWDRYKAEEIPLPAHPLVANDPHSLRLRHVSNMDHEPVTEQNIRDARRAYFAEISFVDDQLGALLTTLRQTGLADDTMTIFTSDHGEMLGERGLWYKMSFFENACRVPLIIHAPGRLAPRRVENAVSTIDLLPTFAEIAGVESGLPLNGRSLVPHLLGTGGHDEVIGEYLGEGTIAPLVMIRRGDYKFIHSPADPDQLYNIKTDPDELVNLAADPAYAAPLAGLRAEAAQRWDFPTIHAQVIASQRQRRFVYNALRQGHFTPWDYQPVSDAANQYMRNHLKLDELERRARFPAVV